MKIVSKIRNIGIKFQWPIVFYSKRNLIPYRKVLIDYPVLESTDTITSYMSKLASSDKEDEIKRVINLNRRS